MPAALHPAARAPAVSTQFLNGDRHDAANRDARPACRPRRCGAEGLAWHHHRADDASLAVLLAAALDLCADFIGRVPLAATIEETLPLTGAWQELASRPVTAISSVRRLPLTARVPRGLVGFDCEILADGPGGCGSMTMARSPGSRCGSPPGSPDWDHLPEQRGAA